MAHIARSRKSGFVLRSGVMRRETSWVQIAETNTALGAANSAAVFTGFSANLLASRPFTIVRTRLEHFVRSDQRAVTELYQCALGIAIVSDVALGIGVTAVPTPFTDGDSDLFFLWNSITGLISTTSDIGVLEAGKTVYVDSRGMRKVEEGQDIALTIENSSLSSGTNTVKSGRMLIKLH